MSESTKNLVQRFLDSYNRGAWDELDGLVGPDYVHHNNGSAYNLAQYKRGAAWFRAGMPDFHVVVEDLVAEADRVAVRFVAHGTHLGSLYGETPTSKAVMAYGIMIVRFQDGRIAEDWEALDEHDLMRQIGAVSQED